jgi:hypothetical protein
MAIAASQTPAAGTLNVDHVAHFVPDRDAAGAALEKLGFTLTPFSPQSHRLQADGPLVPAGTGNRCVMLGEGYLEFLTPTADTPVANQLRTAIDRYVGVHLIAFGTSVPERDYARLAESGFQPLAPIALQREIQTPAGIDTARFTVVRVPPGTMPEGRIQYCAHRTPQLVWQTRWLEHANAAVALEGVLLCVESPQAAAQRYGRFTGIAPVQSGTAWRLDTARGYLLFASAGQMARAFGASPPALPWIAGYVLASSDMRRTRYALHRAGATHAIIDGRSVAALPATIGGIAIFEPSGSPPLNLRA